MEKWKEKLKERMKDKKFLCVILAAVTIVLLMINGYINLRSGIYLKDYFFYRLNDERYETFSHDVIVKRGDHYKVRFKKQFEELDLVVIGDNYSFTFADGTQINGKRIADTLTDEEGFPLEYKWIMDTFDVHVGKEYISGGPEVSKIQIALCVMKLHTGELEPRMELGMLLVTVLGGLLLTLIGAGLLLWPEETYTLFNQWFFKNVELSDTAIALRQIAGVVFVILGLFFSSGMMTLL